MSQQPEMSAEEKIAYLAAKVMGWEIIIEVNEITGEDYKMVRMSDRGFRKMDILLGGQGWNPLTDWNHWRQVEETLKDNSRLCEEYCNKLPRCAGPFDTRFFVWADLPTRVAALIAAHKELYGK